MDYTPDYEEVRGYYIAGRQAQTDTNEDARAEEFDRFIEAVVEAGVLCLLKIGRDAKRKGGIRQVDSLARSRTEKHRFIRPTCERASFMRSLRFCLTKQCSPHG